MADISRLLSTFQKNDGYAPVTKYTIILPPIMPTVSFEDLNVQCKSVSIPGFTITSKPSRTNMLPIETPTGFEKDTCEMRFIETGKYNIMKYFDFWFERIVSKNQYYVKYRQDICFDILIFAEKMNDEKSYMARLRNAWPKARTKLNYDGDADGGAMIVDITFEYEDLHTENLDVSFADLGIRLGADFFLDTGFEISNGLREVNDSINDAKEFLGKIF